MEGRVLWYKPSSGCGSLVSNAGRSFAFQTPGPDGTIHGGARVTFKVSERDGDLIGVNVRVMQTCVDALVNEDADLARKFRQVVAFDAGAPARRHRSAVAR